jgi:hypothetical protein
MDEEEEDASETVDERSFGADEGFFDVGMHMLTDIIDCD